MKKVLAALIGGCVLSGVAAFSVGAQAPAAKVTLTRLDCGELQVSDFGVFSDTGAFDGQTRRLVDGCYLVRHGDEYLLWDTGLPASAKGNRTAQGVFTPTLRATVLEQLAQLGVRPEQVTLVGVSHTHSDHTGQARDFPRAKLLIGRGDLDAARAAPDAATSPIAPWLAEGANVEAVAKDKDVFGDGSVVMLDMRGHTPGHHALLVRLAKKGAVLLTGDQFHSAPSYERGEVPTFNADRAQTLASHDRFKRIAANLKATVVIQHEAADVSKLPAFPQAAE